jgi:ABC-type Mn2+/Zn2+ transport system permease subunit
MTSGLTWNVVDDVRQLLSFHLMVNALRAGTIAALPGGGRADTGLRPPGGESAVIGTVQGLALACGFLFVSLYHGFLSGLNSLLFGTIIGVTDDQVRGLLIAPSRGSGAVGRIAVVVTWAGEGIAFYSPYPIGFWITTFAFGLFLLAAAWRAVADALGRRRFPAIQATAVAG